MNSPVKLTWLSTHLLWVLLLGAVVWTAHIHDSDLRKDNVLYASIAKQLSTSDNPLELRWGDEVYRNKPPLFFWSTAGVMKVLGPTVTAAKSVSILFGLGCLALLFLVAQRVTGSEDLAALAGFVCILTYPINRATSACRMESMVVFFMVASLLLFLHVGRSRSYLSAVGSGLCLGLAVLTKGPQAFLALVAMGCYLVIPSRFALPKPRLKQAALLLLTALALGGSWYMYQGSVDEGMAGNLRREAWDRIALTGSGQFASDPWYTYLANLFTQYVIFIPFLVLGVLRARKAGWKKPETLLLGGFALLTFVAVHFLSTKYIRYLYSFYLLAAIPVAWGLPVAWRKYSVRILKVVTLLTVVALFTFNMPFLHAERFSPLREIDHQARESGLPILLSDEFFQHWETRSAALFFLESFQRASASKHLDEYIVVFSQPQDRQDTELLRTPSFAAYQVSPPTSSTGSKK
jgi:4-amino-4-deoxy-L-arabinose transferase-like glycosyltransferase